MTERRVAEGGPADDAVLVDHECAVLQVFPFAVFGRRVDAIRFGNAAIAVR